ncbi:MAG: hypothetical protein K0Q79_647 [Flavipsychrobacter sp.]|jgi:hypothetical protein|nr:hypothetical protein [Flavipsychrobacter sp.]
MRRHIALAFFVAGFFYTHSVFASVVWKHVARETLPASSQKINASRYEIYHTDELGLKAFLFSLPANEHAAQIISVPMPDGTMREFKVWYTPMMPAELAARYPELRTFTGVAVDDPVVTIKLDHTVYGFHAMVFGEREISFVDPAGDGQNGYYAAHYKRDEVAVLTAESKCAVIQTEPATKDKPVDLSTSAYRVSNGNQKRTYSLALSCSHQYAAAATSLSAPTIAQVFSKMVTTMNRVNGVYERELSVTMVFVARQDTLIWNSEISSVNGPDPFGAINSNAPSCVIMNQTVCDNRIGSANYDLGHVFTTGAGGLSDIGNVCRAMSKARSVTGRVNPFGDGFDIDYVAHEIGHQFGGSHTFNGSDNFCLGNWHESAYEPGSGSTIMAYAGLCSPDDIQPYSDDYFHAVSLQDMHSYITNWADGCATKTATGNKTVYLPSFTHSYSIPAHTPFELTAPAATDSVASASVTYCWEQWNLAEGADKGKRFVDIRETGPIFRSYRPTKSNVRVFPEDTMVLAGKLSNAGKENAQGEKVPDTDRYLTFKLTMRNILNGNGCVLIPDDTIHLNVVNTGKGFKVTSQDDSTAVYYGGSTQEVKWDVAGTDISPISATSVDIYMSKDGGYTWPYYIGNFPNTGSALIPLANPDSATKLARIKVKGAGNVFFNVNKYNFSVTHSDGTDTAISVSPVPTHTNLRVASGNKGEQRFAIFDMAGREVYTGRVNGLLDIPVYEWPRGMYIIRLFDTQNRKTILKFVVQ